MKNYKIYYFLGILLAFTACSKDDPSYAELTDSKKGVLIGITKFTGNTQNLTIFPFIDEARTFEFSASYGGLGLPKSNITVEYVVDNRAFDSVNVVRQQSGLPLYEKFPAGSYTASGMTATINAGQTLSPNIKISYLSKKFDPTKSYLLPISISNANGYALGTNKTIFIVAGKVQEVRAVTTGWVASASSEQPSGENTGKASALMDGDLATIWHAQYSGGPAGTYPYLIQYDMVNPIYVTKIGIAPRQNNGNGPTLFKLEGSLDGTSWTTLLDNQVFDPNKRDGTLQDYALSAPTNLRYVKVTLLEGKQTLSFLSEIAVYKY
ncbi:MAG: discoidin domain-containing protein [Bacteroidota bacterium]